MWISVDVLPSFVLSFTRLPLIGRWPPSAQLNSKLSRQEYSSTSLCHMQHETNHVSCSKCQQVFMGTPGMITTQQRSQLQFQHSGGIRSVTRLWTSMGRVGVGVGGVPPEFPPWLWEHYLARHQLRYILHSPLSHQLGLCSSWNLHVSKWCGASKVPGGGHSIEFRCELTG